MATPKGKTSHRRTHLRKAHWLGALNSPETTACSHCGEPVANYTVCPACGYYKGRKVMTVAADKAAAAAESEEAE
ncbi:MULTISPECIES: 50S ribosomal protein L32 [Jonquetella]|uniref:Large ribosomal subunit protein bL32 n=1 Tax=Jonquetella anthropi DSM 22815 TaxID=885272 RepID=H0UJV7_9BACT|nr:MULTISPECIES: 50S ribosomal protein L32 [Jonquetella]EHM12966.1 ribosomal protein L32 [Jonquetella anthropi DSM 22815]ERL23498.1 ribosomal protein L32 [Jonquetella sp. BV3C21]